MEKRLKEKQIVMVVGIGMAPYILSFECIVYERSTIGRCGLRAGVVLEKCC